MTGSTSGLLRGQAERFDPSSGKMQRSINVAAHAGTAFDGQHLFQIAENRIQKIDPKLAECSPPSRTRRWRRLRACVAEGTLWVGSIGTENLSGDPETGSVLAHRVQPLRHGVTWVDGDSGTPHGKVKRAT